MDAIFPFLIPLAAIMLAAFAVYLKHQQKMAGIGGRGANSETVRLLTETLERQHEKQLQLQRRVETLEAIVTNERVALSTTPPPLALPHEEAPFEPSSVRTPDRTRS